MPNINDISGVAVVDISQIDGVPKANILALNGIDILEPVHVFLLVGQSNMVGRPTFDGGEGYPDGTLQYPKATGYDSGYTDTTTIAASPPLQHWDATAGDMGLALQFAIDYHQQTNAQVVLIPAADGGTGFAANNWNPGNPQYEHAINATNALMAANPDWLLKGILWHQGESDASNASYYHQFYRIVQLMREQIVVADETTPFIVGQLFIGNTSTAIVRNSNVISVTPQYNYHTAFVSSNQLTSYDNLHFDAASLRTFGSRYNDAIPAALTNTPPSYETGAVAHYLLGPSNQLTRSLVPTTPSATGSPADFGFKYSRYDSQLAGVNTNVPETENFTMCFVFSVSNDCFLGGNLSPTTGVDGVSMFYTGGFIRYNNRPQNATLNISAIVLDRYYFVALSIDSSNNFSHYLNSETMTKVYGTQSRLRQIGSNDIALGSDIYGGTFGNNKLCEAIFFDSALSEAELDIVYANSVQRMLDRGVLIGADESQLKIFIRLDAADTTFQMPFQNSGLYDCYVYWGDGSYDHITAHNDAATLHTYNTSGYFEIEIVGTIGAFGFDGAADASKIYNVAEFGKNDVFGAGAFQNAVNLVQDITATDTPTNLTSTLRMFRNTSFNDANIVNWDVSGVTDMSEMFRDNYVFNQNISSWNVSSVEFFSGTFRSSTSFNQPIGTWVTSSATNMGSMFSGAALFNQDISSWDVSNVTSMFAMFNGANAFNQNLNSWDVTNCGSMGYMFASTSMNFPLNLWKVYSSANCQSMFPASMSDANLEATLYAWSLDPNTKTSVNGTDIGGSARTYAAGSNMDLALNDPTNGLVAAKNWNITGITIV